MLFSFCIKPQNTLERSLFIHKVTGVDMGQWILSRHIRLEGLK